MIRRLSVLLAMAAIASLAAAQEYETIPTDEVKKAVDAERGGPPELYRQVMERNQEFDSAMDYMPQANAIKRTVALSMDSLNVPFEVQVAKGYITTLTFIDANGNPYPVRVSRVGSTSFKVCSGSTEDCKVTEADLDIAHILTVGTPAMVGRSNLRVFFKGLYKAVQISLVVKRTSYHDEVTIMLPVANPDHKQDFVARASSERTIKDSDDYYARALIDGISVSKLPKAVELNVEVENRIGEKAQATNVYAIYADGNTYIKTTLRMPNPHPTAMTNGFMNEMVYRFNGRIGVVSGFDENGQVLVLKMSLPDSVLGYREVRE